METGNLMIDAQTAFARARRRRRRARVLGWLLRRPGRDRRLPLLTDELDGLPPRARRSAGLATIPLCSVVGTTECAKARSFDCCFLPSGLSRHRWERLWMAGRRGAPIPPISVYRVGDRHFVDDGHHRVSVARSLGMAAIDAEVTEIRR
jgi:ParB-like chromosome segregation protein Spo0J